MSGTRQFGTLATVTCVITGLAAWIVAAEAEIEVSASAAKPAPTHWAFKPVAAHEPPGVSDPAWTASPIDRFVRAAHVEHGLKPSSPAHKRTLIRRATFDLTGLPPTPEETRAFLADESADAFAAVIDRLLASPRYGERWGRHWLDVVRYADTAGETADFPVPHAWRYRNWVIDAFNRDKPYDQFLTEQIAGDILADRLPADVPAARFAELVTATGFVSIARRFGFDTDHDQYLTIDDTLDMLGKSVLGLSISCARCHDHKYDPISAHDYYALYGIFESTRYPSPGCEKSKTPRDLVVMLPRAEIERAIKPHQRQLAELDAAAAKLNEEQTRRSRELQTLASQSARLLAEGQIDNGGAQDLKAAGAALEPIDVQAGQVVQLSILPRANHGADSTSVDLEITEIGGEGRKWNVASDLVPELLAGNPHADSYGNAAIWCLLDLREGPALLNEALRNVENKAGLNVWRRGDTPAAFANATDQEIKAWTVTFLPRSFALHPGPAGGVAVAWICPIDGKVTISGRVADADATGGDGIAWKLEQLTGAWTGPLTELGRLAAEGEAFKKRRGELAAAAPKFDVAYAVAEGQPHHAQLQKRGDPNTRGEEVPRRFLQVLGGQNVPAGAGSGRLELAGWLTDPANPLTARVMVNRVWQHHFGAGLVKTPSDFGLRGLPPSHPELLDFLAGRFMASGWSIKALHRLIMLSSVYQQAFSGDAAGSRIDPDNRWLSHFSRRRLSAEEIRDSILAVSGDLDLTPGGAHPFPDEKSWGFTQHDPFSAVYDHNRRSVYLMTQRIKRHPFLTLFDGADANASTADRYTTTVPTQALFFLNDPFVHARSASLADRLLALPDDRSRLDQAFELMFARMPTEEDFAAAAQFLSGYTTELVGLDDAARIKAAWSAWLRVMMSGSEFIYVD